MSMTIPILDGVGGRLREALEVLVGVVLRLQARLKIIIIIIIIIVVVVVVVIIVMVV